MEDFGGVKIALLTPKDELVVYLRDNKPGLRFAGLWDLPGGGREGDESAFECVKREIKEELDLELDQGSIVYSKTFSAMHDPGLTAYFMVARISDEDIERIDLHEGQEWKLMGITEFMESLEVVEPLKGRLGSYLSSVGLAGFEPATS